MSLSFFFFLFQIHADAEESVDEDLVGSSEALNPVRVDDIEGAEASASQEPCGSHAISQRVVVCRDEGAAQESSILSTQETSATLDPIEPVGDALLGVPQDIDFTPGVASAAPTGLDADSSKEALNQDGSIAEPPSIP